VTKRTRIKKWINRGELADCETVGDIVEVSGRLLDKAYASEIIGPALFQAANGKYYLVAVEALVEEASPEYVKEALAEAKERE